MTFLNSNLSQGSADSADDQPSPAPKPRTHFPRASARRRSAVEPIIGHMKSDGHLGRCHLKGREGDAINVLLTAVGHNLCRVLARLRTLLTSILIALWRTASLYQGVRPA